MLIIALVLAVIGLAALVTAVVTSNAVVAWVCIGASVIGVVLLIVDAIRERQRGQVEDSEADDAEESEPSGEAIDATYQNFDAEYPDDEPATEVIRDESVPADEVESGAGEAWADSPVDEPADDDTDSRDTTTWHDSKPASS